MRPTLLPLYRCLRSWPNGAWAPAITEAATPIVNAPVLAGLAVQHRLPSVDKTDLAQAGGLLGDGTNREAIFRPLR